MTGNELNSGNSFFLCLLAGKALLVFKNSGALLTGFVPVPECVYQFLLICLQSGNQIG